LKTVWFFLFLATLASWIGALALLRRRLQQPPMRGKSFLHRQAEALLSACSLFLLLLTLARVSSPMIAVGYWLTAQVAILLVMVSVGLLGIPRESFDAWNFWIGYEFGARHRRYVKLWNYLPLVLWAIGAFVVGIIYFSANVPSQPMTRATMGLIVFLFLVVRLVFSTPLLVFMLASPNVGEDARRQSLIEMAGEALPWIYLLQVCLTTLGVQHETVHLASQEISVSVLAFAALGGALLLLTLMPFLIGERRAARWRAVLLEEQINKAKELADTLRLASSSSYVPKLRRVFGEFQRRDTEFAERSPSLRVSANTAFALTAASDLFPDFAEDEIRRYEATMANLRDAISRLDESQLVLLREAFQVVQSEDPRLTYWQAMMKTQVELIELRQQLEDGRAPASAQQTAERWVGALETRTDDLREQLKSVTARKPWGTVFAAIVLTPLLTSVVDRVADLFWSTK
jgi:hypothetical protein